MGKKVDLLDREDFVEKTIRLVNQLSENKRGCCFAIEGSWGIGKTFVLDKVEEKLKAEQSEETNGDRYFVFHYNCWQHDYYEEPAVAIISAMLASVQEDKTGCNSETGAMVKAGWKLVKDKLKEITGIYLENKIGINLISMAENVIDEKNKMQEETYAFDKMFNFTQTIESVRERLKEIAEERTIVLIVDELDRCIPQYAIKVLERLHHIFCDLENIVVIMAIDRKQLEHSVEEMFGTGKDENAIDVDKYLKKFIDFSMVLDNGNINDSFWEKYQPYYNKFEPDGDSEDKKIIDDLIPNLFRGTDIRRQEKIVEKANIIHSIVAGGEKVNAAVLAFELLYEVLNLWKFGNMKYVALINDAQYVDLENRLGKEKTEFLKSLEAASHFASQPDSITGQVKKCLCDSLYGRVIWYFANIFNKDSMLYYPPGAFEEELPKELEIAQNYCDLCEIIR